MKILNYTGRGICFLTEEKYVRGLLHYTTPNPHPHCYTETEKWSADVPLSYAERNGEIDHTGFLMGTSFNEVCIFSADGHARIVEEEPLKSIARAGTDYKPSRRVRYLRYVSLKTQQIVGLPEPCDDTLLIVWPEVAAAARGTGRGTHDLLVPGKPVFRHCEDTKASYICGDFAPSLAMIKFIVSEFGLYCRGYRELSLYDEDGSLQAKAAELPVTADGKIELEHLFPKPSRPVQEFRPSRIF